MPWADSGKLIVPLFHVLKGGVTLVYLFMNCFPLSLKFFLYLSITDYCKKPFVEVCWICPWISDLPAALDN